MRVSTSYQYRVYSDSIRTAQERTFEAQRRLLSGKRVESMSDDPIAGSLILNARGMKAGIAQYDTNLKAAKDYLGSSEIAVNDINGLLRNAYQAAVRAANGVYDQDSRAALANDIASMQKRLTELANSKGARGQYLFGGQTNDSAPFTVMGSTLVFNGDTNDVQIETGPGQTMAVNSQLSGAIVKAYADLEQLRIDLTGGNLGAISGVSIPALQKRMEDMRAELAQIGSKASAVNELTAHNGRRSDELTARIAELEEVDLAQALTEYQAAQTAYQAAMQTAAAGFNLSLIDFLR